jgi:methyltransferase-like protein 6
VDIVLAIFALSAVKPEYHRQSMEHIYSLLVKENGNGNESKDKHENQNKSKFLLFRDYGLHDLTMYRHQYRYNEFTFGRQDGTICYYFSIEYFTRLAESVGFVVRECEYATVINHNRKTNQALYRVFLHAVLEVKIL